MKSEFRMPQNQKKLDELKEYEGRLYNLLKYGINDDLMVTSVFMAYYANFLNSIAKTVDGTYKEQIRFALAIKKRVEDRIKREEELQRIWSEGGEQ